MRKMSIAVILAVLAAGPALASDKTDVMAPVHQFVDGFNKNDVKTAEASITIYDPSHQGRAPVWSPDGNYMAFESDRAGGYAVFLAKVKTGTALIPAVQITDASYGAQHPKFFPDQTKLILTAFQVPNSGGARGIAWVDISEYL